MKENILTAETMVYKNNKIKEIIIKQLVSEKEIKQRRVIILCILEAAEKDFKLKKNDIGMARWHFERPFSDAILISLITDRCFLNLKIFRLIPRFFLVCVKSRY